MDGGRPENNKNNAPEQEQQFSLNEDAYGSTAFAYHPTLTLQDGGIDASSR